MRLVWVFAGFLIMGQRREPTQLLYVLKGFPPSIPFDSLAPFRPASSGSPVLHPRNRNFLDSVAGDFTNLAGWTRAADTLESTPLPATPEPRHFYRVAGSFDRR